MESHRQFEREARTCLEESGLLMLSDPRFPSVAGMVTGGPVAGSWWSHPASHTIFAVSAALAHDPAVLTCKLLSGRVTYVHRRLWSPLMAAVTAREEWQTAGLSAAASTLLLEPARQDLNLRPPVPKAFGTLPGWRAESAETEAGASVSSRGDRI